MLAGHTGVTTNGSRGADVAKYLFLNSPEYAWQLADSEDVAHWEQRLSTGDKTANLEDPFFEIPVKLRDQETTLYVRRDSIVSFAVIETGVDSLSHQVWTSDTTYDGR
jgi:hypothetical protein